MGQYKCFATDQIFVSLNGTVSPCCLAHRHFRPKGETLPDNIMQLKERNNQQIAKGDLSMCWNECKESHRTTAPYSVKPSKLVVYTNTLCPLRCTYCSLTNLEFQHLSRRTGATVPLVAQAENNMEGLESVIDAILSSPGGESIRTVELTGGDSAYHPGFESILDYLASRGVSTIYLSSGVVPKPAMAKILEKVQLGVLEVSISTDAASAGTWSKIKKRPAKEFKRVCEMIKRITEANASKMHVKFIVMGENAREAGNLVEFYHRLGVVNFCVSEMREQQALYRVKAPTTEVTIVACRDILNSFNTLELDTTEAIHMMVVGLEKHFQGQRTFSRFLA